MFVRLTITKKLIIASRKKDTHEGVIMLTPAVFGFCEIIVFLCITTSKIMQASKIKTGMFG